MLNRIEWLSWARFRHACADPFMLMILVLVAGVIGQRYQREAVLERDRSALEYWRYSLETPQEYNATLTYLNSGVLANRPQGGDSFSDHMIFARDLKLHSDPATRMRAYLNWQRVVHPDWSTSFPSPEVKRVLRDPRSTPLQIAETMYGFDNRGWSTDVHWRAMRDYLSGEAAPLPIPSRPSPSEMPPRLFGRWFLVFHRLASAFIFCIFMVRGGFIRPQGKHEWKIALPANLAGWMVIAMYPLGFLAVLVLELAFLFIGYCIVKPLRWLYRFATTASLENLFTSSPKKVAKKVHADTDMATLSKRVGTVREQIGQIKDPVKRQQALDRLTASAGTLRQMEDEKREHGNVTRITDELDELEVVIAALHDAEQASLN